MPCFLKVVLNLYYNPNPLLDLVCDITYEPTGTILRPCALRIESQKAGGLLSEDLIGNLILQIRIMWSGDTEKGRGGAESI